MQISTPLDAAATLSDTELVSVVKRLAANERHATVQLVAHLAEMDARRLYLGEGCSSLFTYCTQVLHLSEHAAYARIEAARAARRFPAILEAVANGALHLTAVTLIAPHVTVDNIDRVIAAATHKTKRNVEELVATLRPQPPVPASVRKLPQSTQCHSRETAMVQADVRVRDGEADLPRAAALRMEAPGPHEAQPAVQRVPVGAIRPLAPEQYLVKFTASQALHDKLREVRTCCGTRCLPAIWPRSSIGRGGTLVGTQRRKPPARGEPTLRPGMVPCQRSASGRSIRRVSGR